MIPILSSKIVVGHWWDGILDAIQGLLERPDAPLNSIIRIWVGISNGDSRLCRWRTLPSPVRGSGRKAEFCFLWFRRG
ncbi:MAG: hypothetical protein HY713_10015 [candidate division NC10 bacterium]|nr:hypothetical protein [candidate division NC10 bacterium]